MATDIYSKIATLKDFIYSCDDLFKKWESNTNLVSHYGYDPRRFQDGIPEPYLGSPCNSSAVIVNINPGEVECGFNCREKILGQNPLVKSYHDNFARDFPYKLTKTDNRKGSCATTDWWVYRNRWIKGIVENVTGSDETDRRPFAMELCPWHSKKWNGWSNLKDYVENWVMEPLRSAIKESQLPFALAVVGPSVYRELIDGCGFEEIKVWKVLSGAISHPSKPILKQQGRFYALLRKDKVYILCTFYFGGNQVPSEKYKNVEKNICATIMSMI